MSEKLWYRCILARGEDSLKVEGKDGQVLGRESPISFKRVVNSIAGGSEESWEGATLWLRLP